MGADRPLTVLIGALGGQGGGVLAEWLAEAAHLAGYPAQVTSTPGVAQRTGATTYYFELFPERTPAADPVFSLFPCTDDVDLVTALEPMEAARALGLGFVTGRTVVVTARERVYAIGEKVVAGDGMIDAAGAVEALSRAAKRVIALDLGGLAAAAGSRGNAVLFGAIAGSGVLPLAPDVCRKAIDRAGVNAKANLAGFSAGFEAVTTPSAPPSPLPAAAVMDTAPAAFQSEVDALPGELRILAGHALAQLAKYQDGRYAALFLKRLRAVVEADRAAGGGERGFVLSQETARRLAAWMRFEDVIRVAELKTQPGRLARIRAEIGAGVGEPVRVTDFLSPRGEEITGLLPLALARLVPRTRNTATARGLALRFPTGTPLGFAVLKAIAKLKRWRPRTARYSREQVAIESWLNAVVETARSGDYTLACRVTELAVWARGYGDVRSAGNARLARLFDFDDFAPRLATDRSRFADEVAAALADARDDPDGHCRPAQRR